MNTLLLALSDGAKKGLMFGLLAVVLVGMIVFSFISNKKNKKKETTEVIPFFYKIKYYANLLYLLFQANIQSESFELVHKYIKGFR